MKLHHSTSVRATPDQVWRFLQDTHAVVACLPGAKLTDDMGDDRYGGVLQVAFGPLKLNYNGEVDVTRRDADTRKLEFSAAGRDRRGGGSVRADVRVDVADAGEGLSQLECVTDLHLTGRVAALGRGVQDVSNTMFSDFSRSLAEHVAGSPGSTTASNGTAEQPRTAAYSPGAAAPSARQSPVAVPSSSEIKLTQLVVRITRQRLADLLQRWSQRLRP